jgi:hypothetical protein
MILRPAGFRRSSQCFFVAAKVLRVHSLPRCGWSEGSLAPIWVAIGPITGHGEREGSSRIEILTWTRLKGPR